MLRWDLHLHPGPSRAPRWGDGAAVRRAARAAGVEGFVWKAHEEHTAVRCRELGGGPPYAIGSASLNAWASPESVLDAVAAGAGWLWGPTLDGDDRIGWDLPLPEWTGEVIDELERLGVRMVVGSGHVGMAERRWIAERLSGVDTLCASATHALGIAPSEAAALAALGCALELDVYTFVHAQAAHPRADDVARWLAPLDGADVYVTSDGGQAATGDPFAFAERHLPQLLAGVAPAAARRMTDDVPTALARHVLGTAADGA